MEAPTSGGVRQHPYSNGATRTVSDGGGDVVTNSPGGRRSAARRRRVPVHLNNDCTSGSHGRPAWAMERPVLTGSLHFIIGDEMYCAAINAPIHSSCQAASWLIVGSGCSSCYVASSADSGSLSQAVETVDHSATPATFGGRLGGCAVSRPVMVR